MLRMTARGEAPLTMTAKRDVPLRMTARGEASLRMTAKKGSLATDDITARPPGSRDGCPTIAPRFNGIDLWGTRLACRMHGWSTAH